MKMSQRDFFSAFVNVSKAISSTMNIQEILDLIVRNAVEALELMAGAFSLWRRRENRLEMISHLNLSAEFLHKGPVRADKSMPRALTTKKPVLVPDIDHDHQLQYPAACKREGIKALFSIPIIFKDEVIGVLRLYDSKVRRLGPQEMQFVIALAEQGGIAIENARFMEQMKKDHAREMDDLWKWYSGLVETPQY